MTPALSRALRQLQRYTRGTRNVSINYSTVTHHWLVIISGSVEVAPGSYVVQTAGVGQSSTLLRAVKEAIKEARKEGA